MLSYQIYSSSNLNQGLAKNNDQHPNLRFDYGFFSEFGLKNDYVRHPLGAYHKLCFAQMPKYKEQNPKFGLDVVTTWPVIA